MAFLLMSAVFFDGCMTVFAAEEAERYNNPETGYKACIQDEAGLLDAEEEAELLAYMIPITERGNVLFLTTEESGNNALRHAGRSRESMFGKRVSAVVFMIDMKNREVVINSDGNIYRYVRERQALSITDNVYSYAKNEDYYSCAAKAFEQIDLILRGERILEPMRYTTNALLAVSLSTILAFLLLRRGVRKPVVSDRELLESMVIRFESRNAHAELKKQVERHEPVRSRSAGGDGGSSGGISSGGGGSPGGTSSGGGGSHRF